jgi:SAM-dependent methyltransferase
MSEFDGFSGRYEELLRDPIRDRFGGASSEFFYQRKSDLIRQYFRREGVDTHKLSYLDLGCGKGELLSLLRDDFALLTGCDPSSGMLESVNDTVCRMQDDPARIPFDDAVFDFVTAVCVYHHVRYEVRPFLTKEVRRVLKPGGVFCIIEHNPLNPVTRLIVSRTPVDAEASLLRPSETRRLIHAGGFILHRQVFFLYFPQNIYRRVGGLESLLSGIPLGGQYAAFCHRTDECL